MKTVDGGLTWEPQYSGVEGGLNSIFFIDEDRGWAVGVVGYNNYPGVIIHTNDGGNTWQTQCDDIGRWFTSVHFPDADNGWAVGASGIIMHTNNGGAVWTPDNSYNQRLKEVEVYPNPSSGKINVSIYLVKSENISLNVFDNQGNLVKAITTGNLIEGEQNIKIDLSHLPDGLYFIRLQAGKRVETVKVVLLK